MPMSPGDGESKDDFMKRCVAHHMEDKGRPQDQSVAICMSVWENPPKKAIDDSSVLHRAFSMLTVKSVDEGRRTITGIASTPTVDRVGDVVDPLGAEYATPMPLLMFHDAERPVGTVDLARPTKDGIPFSASIPEVKEPGVVRERVLEALHSLKYKLLGAVSIGFVPIEGGVEVMKSGGLFYRKWRWLELSICAVPANPEAVIMGFKSMDPVKIKSALSIVDPPRKGVVRLDDVTIQRAKFGDKPGVVYLKK